MELAAAELILPLIALVFTAAFLGLWQADQTRPHLLGFAAGFFALFLAMSLHLFFPRLWSALGTTLLHILACCSVIAIAWGSARRLNHKIPLAAMLAVTVLSSAVLYPALDFENNIVALVVQNGASGMLFSISAVTLWLARPISILDRILIWTMASIAAFGLLRPAVLLLMEVEIDALVQRQTEFNTLSLLVMTALTVILALCLVAIAVREALEIRLRSYRSDPISGFLDRHTFEQKCETALANAHRLGLPATLAIFEIDRFEAFKLQWGEETSNLTVRDLSDMLRACQRDGDIAGRIGEGRFGVLLIGMGADSGLKFALTLRENVKREWVKVVTGMMSITLSCAINEGKDGVSFKSVSNRAYASLRQARMVGTNCIFVNGVEFERTELGPAETSNIVAHG